MLRAIISIYFGLALILALLIAIGTVAVGLTLAISGDTSALRSLGFGLLLWGPLVAISVLGNVAIGVENNRLLRRIAGEDGMAKGRKASAEVVTRREPTFSSSVTG